MEAYQGQCYAASEALYHLLGGKKAGYTPVVLTLPEGSDFRTHWYLEDPWGGYLDPTADQFPEGTHLPYHLGTRKGFLTKQPSRKANVLIAIARERI